MADTHRSGKLAVILHADIAGSTVLVQRDEHLAHERIQGAFRSFRDLINRYHGQVRELRGDALLAEFERASDAVCAALEFQRGHAGRLEQLDDDVKPAVRIGVSLGEVVMADDTVTGAGVVLAQRIEQLAEPGGLCITAAIHEALPGRMPFEQTDLGERELKGFDEPVRVYRVGLKPDASIPPPVRHAGPRRFGWKLPAAVALAALLAAGSLLWLKPWQVRDDPASVDRMAFPLPDKPSIAVLPFANLGGGPEQEYFADGITNDLITDLSKFNNLFVIAANSTFTYKGNPVKVQQVAEDLGVRYVLEGSVRRIGDTVRINTQLIDALSGHHLWAERYDRKADDLFAIQNEILQTIVGTLDLEVSEAETKRAFRKPTDELKAYDYYQRGYAYFLAWGEENHAKAAEMFEKAIELDPEYSNAYATLAVVHVANWRYNWIDDTSQSLAVALDLARKSVELDPDDYWNIWDLGHVYLANGDSELALNTYEKALSLNPNDPSLLMEMVELLVSIGRADQAVAQAKAAIRRNPRHPGWYLWNLGWAEYFAGDHEQAVQTLQKMTEPPNGVRRILAPALVRVGRLDEAREMIKEYMKNAPEQTVADVRKLKYKYRPFIEKWAGDLLVAGLPEGPAQGKDQ